MQAHAECALRREVGAAKRNADGRSRPRVVILLEQIESVIRKDDRAITVAIVDGAGGDDVLSVKCNHLKGGTLICSLVHISFPPLNYCAAYAAADTP